MNSAAMATDVQPNIFDGSNLSALKRLTKQSDPAAIKSAAQQFEAIFVQMMLKSMRDATPRDEAMGSDQQRMYESLLDQQLSQVLSTRGGGMGLAAMIEKQMAHKQPDLDASATGISGISLTPPQRAFSIAPQVGKRFDVK
jgi:flagellar protein FlgJ